MSKLVKKMITGGTSPLSLGYNIQNPFSLGSLLPTQPTLPPPIETGGGNTPYLKQNFAGRSNAIAGKMNKAGITDKGVNLIANLVTQGADMAQGALENGVTNSKGYDMFKQIGNMKTGNAVIDAGKAVAMMGISAMNRWGGQESDEFYVDRLLQETMGGSYVNSFKDLNEAEQGNGFYGMFSLGKKKKQDANVAKQEEVQAQLQDINEEAQVLYAAANNVQANNIKYLNKINGIDFSEFSLVAKNGIKLEHLSRVKLLKNKHFINLDTKRVEEFKLGGIIEQPTIEFVPIIVEPVKYFKNGGTLIDEWMPVVVDSIEIFKDGGKTEKKDLLETASTYSDWWRGTWSYLSGNKDSKLLESLYRPTKSTNPNTKYYYRAGLNNDVVKNILGGLDYGKKDIFGNELFYKDFNDVWDRLSVEGGRAERNTDNSQLGAYTIGIGEDTNGRYISYYDKFDWAPDGVKDVFNPYEIYNRIYEDEFNNIQAQLKNVEYSGINPSGKSFFKNSTDLYNYVKPTYYEDGGSFKPSKQFPQEYIDFINSVKSVAPNFGELEPEGYNMYRYWELNGKPKNWDEALQKEMFHKQKDGYHAHSVAWNENGEGEWMKHKTFPTAWMEKAFYDGYEFLTDPETGEPLFLDRMPEYEGVHPILIPLRGEQAEESKRFREKYELVEDENGNRKYILRKTEKHKEGGSIKESDILVKLEETNLKNVIPEGALHKNKHHIENTEGLTLKGIPVIDNDGEQQAEIELNEIIFTLEVTKKLEELHKIYKEGTNKERDEAAIEAGKLLVQEILYNTDDRTGLITKCLKGGIL